MRRTILAATVAALLAAPGPAAAKSEAPAPAPPPAAPIAPPPFEADLLRFSEVLGIVSYLDGLCGSVEADGWRRTMEQMLAAQKLEGDDRRRYVAAFNRGYRTLAALHRSCTARTRAVLQRYLAQGAAIADRIDERFGRGGGAGPAPSTGLPRD